MTEAFTISAPTIDDAAELSAVAQASFREAFVAQSYPPEDLAHFLDTAMGMGRFAAQLADPDYSISVARGDDGAIIGYVKMGPNHLPMPQGEPDPALSRELHQLYLLPAAQGTGVAGALMAWAQDEARSHGALAIYLSVFIENIRAQRFYARHGFVEIGKNPFRVGTIVDDDRVWKCTL